MTYNNENALAEVKNFTLPAMIESDFSNEELSEDFDGLQMSFQRVKSLPGVRSSLRYPETILRTRIMRRR